MPLEAFREATSQKCKLLETSVFPKVNTVYTPFGRAFLNDAPMTEGNRRRFYADLPHVRQARCKAPKAGNSIVTAEQSVRPSSASAAKSKAR